MACAGRSLDAGKSRTSHLQRASSWKYIYENIVIEIVSHEDQDFFYAVVCFVCYCCCFFMRVERIHIPLKWGHHRPADNDPSWNNGWVTIIKLLPHS